MPTAAIPLRPSGQPGPLRVAVDLIDAMAGRLPDLPPLPRAAPGYLVTSLAEPRLVDLAAAARAMPLQVRRRYARYHTDLTLDFTAYWRRLSAGTRAQLTGTGHRIADVSGGAIAISRHRTPAELAAFHDRARRIAARSAQERLAGIGLPIDDAFLTAMRGAAAADRARGWLLTIAGEPAAYCYAEGRGAVLRRDHAGHDPAFDDLSPDAVLLVAVMHDLMGDDGMRDRFERFDFTDSVDPIGERHRRSFATGGVPCIDALLLRPSLSNRLTAGALGAFDQAVVRARKVAAHPAVQGIAKKVRRG